MVRSLLDRFSPRYEKRLLTLCVNNPDNDPDTQDWNKNAVRHMVRKLKKNKKLIVELEKTVKEKKKESKCIIVTKTFDRRLLVSHRRGLPQVIACKLWRWPDLQSHHQILAIDSCEGKDLIISGVRHTSRSQAVCLNPYHYERQQPEALQPVLVSCPKIPPDLTSSFEDSGPPKGTRARPGDLSLYKNLLEDSTNMDPEQEQVPPQQSQHQLEPQQPVKQEQVQQISQQTQPKQQAQYQEQEQQSFSQQASNSSAPGFQSKSSPQYQQTDTAQHQAIPNPSERSQQRLNQQQQHQHRQEQQQQSQSSHHAPPSQGHPLGQYHTQPGYNQAAQDSYAQQDPSRYPATSTQGQYTTGGGQIYYYNNSTFPVADYDPQSQPSPQQQQPQSENVHGDIPFNSEVARPFRFKQNMFTQVVAARARQEQQQQQQQTMIGRYPAYDTQVYSPSSYSYDPSRYPMHSPYQPRQIVPTSQAYNPTSQQQQQAGVYTTTTTPSLYMPHQSTVQAYPNSYPAQQQAQYPQQEQMQLDYQGDAMMPDTGQAIHSQYYNPVPGTSQSQTSQQMEQAPIIDLQEIPYVEGEYWCSISYHEYSQRIGEKYHTNCRVVSVDGYTQPMCIDRFCIGGISNINRNQFTEWVRRRIGRGVRFTYVDGEVYVEGLSDASVFVSNPLLTEHEGDLMYEHVSKLSNGSSAKVFSTQQFAKLLSEAVLKGFESVYKLTGSCVIRVSFVKGWGRNYKRQSIFSTPCWVEVQLNGPLQWIDKALRQMRPPTGCGSTS